MTTLQTTVTVSCCRVSKQFEWEHEALQWLLGHVRRVHPRLLKRVNRYARELARNQNGCGYWDTDNSNGWAKAQATFREAWRRHALKELIKPTERLKRWPDDV